MSIYIPIVSYYAISANRLCFILNRNHQFLIKSIYCIVNFCFSFVIALDHVDKFKELCCSNHLPVLKHLYFSLCFPKEFEQTWRTCPFGLNNEWPFDNIDCYMDETRIHNDGKRDLITEQVFVVYKHPVNILLKYKRSFCNHYFTSLVSSPVKIVHPRSITWNCDPIDEPDRLIKSLQVIASGYVDKLYLKNQDEDELVSE